jgi:hypothetical protein
MKQNPTYHNVHGRSLAGRAGGGERSLRVDAARNGGIETWGGHAGGSTAVSPATALILLGIAALCGVSGAVLVVLGLMDGSRWLRDWLAMRRIYKVLRNAPRLRGRRSWRPRRWRGLHHGSRVLPRLLLPAALAFLLLVALAVALMIGSVEAQTRQTVQTLGPTCTEFPGNRESHSLLAPGVDKIGERFAPWRGEGSREPIGCGVGGECDASANSGYKVYWRPSAQERASRLVRGGTMFDLTVEVATWPDSCSIWRGGCPPNRGC